MQSKILSLFIIFLLVGQTVKSINFINNLSESSKIVLSCGAIYCLYKCGSSFFYCCQNMEQIKNESRQKWQAEENQIKWCNENGKQGQEFYDAQCFLNKYPCKETYATNGWFSKVRRSMVVNGIGLPVLLTTAMMGLKRYVFKW